MSKDSKFELVLHYDRDNPDDAEFVDRFLTILKERGKDAVMEELKSRHEPGEHLVYNRPAVARAGDEYYKDGYLLTYDNSIGYIGLSYNIEF